MLSFSESIISAYTKERLASARFTTPTPVQAATIPQALEGKDVLATAQTGTGKTLAFLIPVMERLLQGSTPGIAALVLVPTRELAMQVVEQYNLLRGKQLPQAACVVGGMGEGAQLSAIRRGARLVVATPGRLEDFLDRKLFNLPRSADFGAGRSGPDARHGISAGVEAHRCGVAEGTSDDVLLGDVGSVGRASGEGLHAQPGASRLRLDAKAFRECADAGV